MLLAIVRWLDNGARRKKTAGWRFGGVWMSLPKSGGQAAKKMPVFFVNILSIRTVVAVVVLDIPPVWVFIKPISTRLRVKDHIERQ